MPTKVRLVKAVVFPVVMYGCESWTRKKAECRRIDAFELQFWRWLLRVPWTARRSNQSILKEIIGRTDAKAEAPILWPPDVKNWLVGKDPDARKDCRQEEKGMREDEMVGWHHRLNGHGFGWTSGVGDGQGGLACYSPWGLKESDKKERLNWTESLIDISRWLTHWFGSGGKLNALFLLGLLQEVNLGVNHYLYQYWFPVTIDHLYIKLASIYAVMLFNQVHIHGRTILF